MREEDAKFKFEKQLPAPDKIEKGKKKKYSSKNLGRFLRSGKLAPYSPIQQQLFLMEKLSVKQKSLLLLKK
jgi:hypothetical protein